jgi:hypothetical protein
MADLKTVQKIRDQISQWRMVSDGIAAERLKVQQAMVEASKLEPEKLIDLEKQLQTLQMDLGKYTKQIDLATEELRVQLEGLFPQPEAVFDALHPHQALALLPVRLETRFKPGALLIRIYPDDIHGDSHEEGLTEEESQAAKSYWTKLFKGTDAETISSLQQALSDDWGAARAAYVLYTSRPEVDANNDLVFPEFPQRQDSWSRAPEAACLPDRWVALGYRNDQEVFRAWSVQVRDGLALGPAPDVAEPNNPGDDPFEVEAGLRWMSDFDTALASGMAIRVALGALDDGVGFDRLLVFGVRASMDELVSAKVLKGLFEGHVFSSGAAFVPQATPTNNTEETSSGFADRDIQADVAQVLDAPALSDLDTRSNAQVLHDALGFDDEGVFQLLHHATDREQADAEHMACVLWPATWGYYLEQMLYVKGTKAFLSKEDIAALRWHYLKYVRARGFLPNLRIDNQPYGFLPVTSLAHWKTKAQDNPPDFIRFWTAQNAVDFLRSLFQIWQGQVDQVPHLGRNPQEPGEDFIRALAMHANAFAYNLRAVVGPEGYRALLDQAGWPADFANNQAQLAGWLHTLTGPLGNDASQLLITATYAACFTAALGEPTVDRNGDDIDGPAPDYIQLLLETELNELADPEFIQNHFDEGKAPLLFALLRHGALQEWSRTSADIQDGDPNFVSHDRLEKELIDIPGNVTVNALRMTDQQLIVNGQPADPVGKILDQSRRDPQAAQPIFDAGMSPTLIRRFGDFWKCLGELKDLPAAQLKQLLRETLDLGSHRLDAWVSSLANQRLSELRDPARPDSRKGIYLGGYAWVEDLRPRQGSPSQGYLHAPSLNQAATAAILKSGHLTHEQNGNGDFLKIDLSSKRTRLALELMAGVRQGQPLAALLGYRFERELRERSKTGAVNLNRFIETIRQFAPLRSTNQEEHGEGSVETVAAHNVVDGLRLLRRYSENQQALWQRLDNDSPAERMALAGAIVNLRDAVDAISDLAIAESVHQLVQGNAQRANASLAAVSAGDVPPEGMDVVRTRRSGIDFTQRMVMVFDDVGKQFDWPRDTVRSRLEPRLNGWLEGVCGNPEMVFCQATFVVGGHQKTALIPLVKLNLAAIDLLYLEHTDEDGAVSAIEAYIACFLIREAKANPKEEIELVFHPEKLPEGGISMAAFFAALAPWRDLILQARALHASDLAIPGDDASDFMAFEIAQRFESAYEQLFQAFEKVKRLFEIRDPRLFVGLEGLLGFSADDDLSGIRSLFDFPEAADVLGLASRLDFYNPDLLTVAMGFLDIAVQYGLDSAVARAHYVKDRDDAEVLMSQIYSTGREVQRRLRRAEAHVGHRNVESALSGVAALVGEHFRVLPMFKPLNHFELKQTWNDSEVLQGKDPSEAGFWLQQMANVKAAAKRLNEGLVHTRLFPNSVIASNEQPNLTVGQLPYEEDDRWMALPLEPKREPKPNAISLVTLGLDGFVNRLDGNSALSGLMIDSWVETLPTAEETTGVAFHFDQPGARASQAVLLAVPPDRDKPWKVEILADILNETLELAKVRGVYPRLLDDLTHFRPAAYFAENLDGETVALNFSNVLRKTDSQ